MNKENPRDNAKRMAEFKERQRFGKAQLKKAKELKSEFQQLDYPGKLKFMDDNFEGISGISDKWGMILSIYPDEKDPEQIRLFNEWQITKYEGFEGEWFDNYSFKRLKRRFEKSIDQIRNINDFPDDLIQDFVARELDTYSERIKDPIFQKELIYYNGNWDLSRKVIDTTFLMARAYSNYVSFLKKQIEIGISPDKKGRTFPEYFFPIPDDKKEWFADQLKKVFNTGKGLQIRYMIEALKELDLLTLEPGQFQKFYDTLKKYFDRDIGAKSGIFDKKTNDLYGPDIKGAEKKIQSLLNQFNKG